MDDDEIDFVDYYLILKKNLVLILILFLIVLGGAFAFLLLTNPVYEAKSVLLLGSGDNVHTEANLIKSDQVLNPVYEQLGHNFEVSTLPIVSSYLVEIKTESLSPLTAKEAANQIAISYLLYMNETRRQTAVGKMNTLETQIESYRKKQERLTSQALNFEQKNKTTGLSKEEKLTYTNVTRTITANDKQINSLMTKRDDTWRNALDNINKIKILNYATIPTQPIKPNFMYDIPLAFIIAAVISYGVVLIKENIQTPKNSQHHKYR